MSVNNNNEPEIGSSDLESVEFESQQLLRDIEKEFETLKEQEAAFTNAEDAEKEEVSSKKSDWMWNLAAVIVFALIGVLGEKAYRVISTKKVEIPEHLESLQEEEDLFAEDTSKSEKAMYLRNALQAQKVQNDDEVNRMMDEELDSYHEVAENNIVRIDTKKTVEVEEKVKPKLAVKEETPVAFAEVRSEVATEPVEKKQQEPKLRVASPAKKVAKLKPVKKVAKLKPVKKVAKLKPVKKVAKRKPVKKVANPKPKFMRYMVVQDKSDLKRGPKASYESVKSVPTGTTFLAETYNKLWVKVDFGQYIEKSRLYNLDAVNPKSFKTVWIKTKKLNVRARATTRSKVLSTLVKADEVKALKVSDRWSAVEGGGFVYSKYLSSEKVYPFELPVVMSVDVSRANIRENASTKAQVVGQYFKGKPLKVHAIKDGWAKVGKYQFISVDLLKVLEAKNMNIAKRKTRKKK